MFRRRPDPRDEIIVWLREQNQDLMDRLQELVGIIHHNQASIASLKHQPENATISGPEASWMSEEEIDAKWQLDHGYIDKTEYEDILKAAGFRDTEIHFD